jgi:hypothetical protein
MEIKMNDQGVFIDQKLYPWKKFYAFEIFDNGLRKFIFLFPNKLSFGLHFPIEEFFIDENVIRDFLKNFLTENQGKVPFIDKIYRSFFL